MFLVYEVQQNQNDQQRHTYELQQIYERNEQCLWMLVMLQPISYLHTSERLCDQVWILLQLQLQDELRNDGSEWNEHSKMQSYRK